MVTAPVLHRLTALASDSSSDGRYRFLSALTDLFFSQPAPTPQASSYFTEIASFSLDRMHDPQRVRFTERVAADDKLPHGLALRLATDPCVEVAGPVLEHSPVLTASDVEHLAATLPPSSLARLAERRDLPDTAATLVSRRTGGAAEPDGKPADGGISGSKRPKKQKSGIQPEATAPVGPHPREGAPASFAPAFRPVAQQARRSSAAGGLKALIAEIAAGERPVDEVVAGLASQDKAFDLARVLGAIGGMPEGVVLKNLLETDIEPIVAASRSAGIGAEGFRAILGLRAARLNLTAREVARHLEVYGESSRAAEPGEA
jgi:hypothetical protein